MSTYKKTVPFDPNDARTSLDVVLRAIIFFTADPDNEADGDDIIDFSLGPNSVTLTFEAED